MTDGPKCVFCDGRGNLYMSFTRLALENSIVFRKLNVDPARILEILDKDKKRKRFPVCRSHKRTEGEKTLEPAEIERHAMVVTHYEPVNSSIQRKTAGSRAQDPLYRRERTADEIRLRKQLWLQSRQRVVLPDDRVSVDGAAARTSAVVTPTAAAGRTSIELQSFSKNVEAGDGTMYKLAKRRVYAENSSDLPGPSSSKKIKVEEEEDEEIDGSNQMGNLLSFAEVCEKAVKFEDDEFISEEKEVKTELDEEEE